jgi:hypothetical protein
LESASISSIGLQPCTRSRTPISAHAFAERTKPKEEKKKMSRLVYGVAIATFAFSLLQATPSIAQSGTGIDSIRAEIQAMKKAYENRITQLESKIKKMEAAKKTGAAKPAQKASSGRSIMGNSFNPFIGVILNGKVSAFS